MNSRVNEYVKILNTTIEDVPPDESILEPLKDLAAALRSYGVEAQFVRGSLDLWHLQIGVLHRPGEMRTYFVVDADTPSFWVKDTRLRRTEDTEQFCCWLLEQPNFRERIAELRKKAEQSFAAGLSDGKGKHMFVVVTPQQQAQLYLSAHGVVPMEFSIAPEQLELKEFEPVEFNSGGLKFKVVSRAIFWKGGGDVCSPMPIKPRVRLTLEPT